jgi:hypothetical protein
MSLPAEVRAMNQVNGRGLLLAEGTFIAFDLVEGRLHVGDLIDGDLVYGPCTWRDLTTGEVVRVYVQQLMTTVEAASRFHERPPHSP